MSVIINSPQAGATLSGTVTVTATYTGTGFEIATVTFDGVQVASDSSLPLSFQADTTRVSDGQHNLIVAVRYRKGSGKSKAWQKASIPVTVSNVAQPPPPPTAKPTVPTGFTGAINGSSIVLNWNANPASDQVDVYQVYIWPPTDGADYDLNILGTTKTITTDINGSPLQAGVTYRFRVSAHNVVGYGDWGNEVSVTMPGTTPEPEPPADGTSSLSYLAWGWQGLPATHINDYRHVMVDEPGQYGSLQASILRYFDGTFVRGDTDRRFCVPESVCRANGWILHNPDGSEKTTPNFGGLFYCDVGDPGYQQAWGQEMIRRLNAEGMDGSFVDDCGRNQLSGSQEYPSSAASQAGMISWIRSLAQQSRAAGKYFVCNAGAYTGGDVRSDTGELDFIYWSALCQGASANQLPHAVMEEYPFWLQVKSDNNGGIGIRKRGQDAWWNYWDEWRNWMGRARRELPIQITGLSDSTDRNQNGYSFASWLLDWEPKNGYFTIARDGNLDPWFDLPGLPLEPARAAGDWVERTFSKGLVRVNPVNGAFSIPGYSAGPMSAPLATRLFGSVPDRPDELTSSMLGKTK